MVVGLTPNLIFKKRRSQDGVFLCARIRFDISWIKQFVVAFQPTLHIGAIKARKRTLTWTTRQISPGAGFSHIRHEVIRRSEGLLVGRRIKNVPLKRCRMAARHGQ